MIQPPPSLPPAPVLDWTAEGAPRAPAFDDIYFQPGEGLAEARAVFLQGCGLPEAWQDRDRFVVGELGFGTGLNILALLELWRRERRPGQRLNVFSVEAFPLLAMDAARALAAWPEMDDLATLLVAAWPPQARGFHRLDLPTLGATIDLGVGEAADVLSVWAGRADAWFLDGFAPAKNPQMWRDEVLALVTARSAPGARLATFTVAGAVRRGLAAHGWTVDKRPGHGRKRERLEGRLSGAPKAPPTPGRIAIIGGGIAGASLARAARTLGVSAVVVAARDGASANPAALVTPGLDAGEGSGGRLYAQAFARATTLYRALGAASVIAEGTLQLEREARDAARFDTVAASSLFEPGALTRLPGPGVAQALGEAEAPGALVLRDGLVVEPSAVTSAWIDKADRIVGTVDRMTRCGGAWRLEAADGALLAEADWVILAAGAGLRTLSDLTLSLVRGQASWAEGVAPGPAAAWGAYAVPTRTGVLFGATHDRGDEALGPRPQDDARNLEALGRVRPRLAARLAGLPLGSRAALRVTTRDRLPVAGELDEGLYILSGLGSRGFTMAPLLAEHLLALVTGAPSPLPTDLAQAVSPDRPAVR